MSTSSISQCSASSSSSSEPSQAEGLNGSLLEQSVKILNIIKSQYRLSEAEAQQIPAFPHSQQIVITPPASPQPQKISLTPPTSPQLLSPPSPLSSPKSRRDSAEFRDSSTQLYSLSPQLSHSQSSSSQVNVSSPIMTRTLALGKRVKYNQNKESIDGVTCDTNLILERLAWDDMSIGLAIVDLWIKFGNLKKAESIADLIDIRDEAAGGEAYLKIVEAQCEKGDLVGAEDTAYSCMDNTYLTLCLGRISSYYLSLGDKDFRSKRFDDSKIAFETALNFLKRIPGVNRRVQALDVFIKTCLGLGYPALAEHALSVLHRQIEKSSPRLTVELMEILNRSLQGIYDTYLKYGRNNDAERVASIDLLTEQDVHLIGRFYPTTVRDDVLAECQQFRRIKTM